MFESKYNPEEKLKFVEEFRNGTQSAYAFARSHNIPESTFRSWIKVNKEVEFGAIQLNSTQTSAIQTNQEDIIFTCENIKIELKKNFNKHLLQRVMEVLINAK